jgi:F-type H+-transporting ATPase subunit delta
MIEEEICQNYAQALINIAGERDAVAEVGREIDAFSRLYRGNPDVGSLLASPRIRQAAKKDMIDGIGGALGLGKLCRNFLKLLVERKRIRFVNKICTEYRKIADERANRRTAYVRTAIPLDKEQQEKLRTILESVTGKMVKLEVEEDDSVIGGIVARVGDKLYDDSVKGELEAIEISLMEGQH